jgi:hypothetical protein
MKDKHFWVCDCHLIENPRMVSQYLVVATGKKEARLVMQDGEHVVDRVVSWVDSTLDAYGSLIDLEDLTEENKIALGNGCAVCLIAGT